MGERIFCALLCLALAVVLALTSGCELFGIGDNSIMVMTYNVHNLFDDIHDGSEYPEFVPGEKWDRSAYLDRLDDIGRVIRGVSGTFGRGPDIVVLTEVENANVVNDLRNLVLGERLYPVALATEVDGNAIQIGLLSRLPVKSIRVHGAYPFNDERIRPVLEAELVLPNEPGRGLHLLATHWPSKIGGEAETEPLRVQVASVIARRAAELAASRPQDMVLVAGDLNQTLPADIDNCFGDPENLEEPCWAGETAGLRSLCAACPAAIQQWGESPSDTAPRAAITPAVTTTAPAAKMSPLLVTHNLAAASENPLVWYSPWDLSQSPGSYVYQQEWERIDHFLLGAGLAGSDYYPADFWVEVREWMCTPSGYPRAYRPSQRTGLSDHFPLVLELRPAKPQAR
ncbi:MAG: endonuclease/exonuclease/phosphatase family protein [Spirochaetaceae bacterium]|nr:MAG: endonuclease/exonuclease/phosphatase family protein [Spirochaetaceae bacterium]